MLDSQTFIQQHISIAMFFSWHQLHEPLFYLGITYGLSWARYRVLAYRTSSWMERFYLFSSGTFNLQSIVIRRWSDPRQSQNCGYRMSLLNEPLCNTKFVIETGFDFFTSSRNTSFSSSFSPNTFSARLYFSSSSASRLESSTRSSIVGTASSPNVSWNSLTQFRIVFGETSYFLASTLDRLHLAGQ